ncbi:MAG TPA: tetratricopeptide repeat protein [Bacteroidales bacterium]|nr:tetratricopeptide repeat protein [Bacteroidales bacterium]
MQQVTGAGGGWYFYNPQAITFGQSEFRRLWGKRKLEDNWRLSDKRTYDDFGLDDMLDPENDTIDGERGGRRDDPLKRETYLKNIPDTPEKIEESNRQIAAAMYQLAYVFREGFRDYPKSADAFEAFLNRFPEHEQELNALYHLYTLYVLENNSAKADQYRQTIIDRYPDSEYASILSDPEYFDKIEAEKRKVHLLYEDTYRAFESGQNRMVVIYSNEAESTYPKSELLPKFAFLRAIAKGRMNNEDTLIFQLQRFIAAHSSSEIVPLAQEMLATFGIEGFGEDELSLTGDPDAPEPEKPSIYSFKPDQNHFFVVIVNHNSINVDATRIRISDFNTNNYKLANLTINAVLIDSDHQMISVSNFRGKDIAMAYYGAITRNDYVFSSQLRRESNYFVISSDNYPIFYADKSIETYMKFFNEHYVK